MLRGTRGLLIAAVVTTVFGAACSTGVSDELAAAERVECPEGSDCYDPPRAPGDGGAVTMDGGDFFYDNFVGEVAEGDIGVTLINVANGTHNIVFDAANQGSDVPIEANGGETASGTVNLFAGEYVFYCSIPGHREAGMEGSLVVPPDLTPIEEVVTAIGME